MVPYLRGGKVMTRAFGPTLTHAPKMRGAMQGDTRIQNLYVTLAPSVAMDASGALRPIPAGTCLGGGCTLPHLDYRLDRCLGVMVKDWSLENERIVYLWGGPAHVA